MRRAIAMVLLGCAASVIWLGYRTYQKAMEAERALHATIAVTRVVEQFVTACRRWPRSWEELEATCVDEWAWYSWPRDSRELRRYVEVEFQTTADKERHRTVAAFHAIRPKTRCAVVPIEGYTIYLLEAVRAAAESKPAELQR